VTPLARRCGWILMVCVLLTCADVLAASSDVLDFAGSLFEDGDYYRAITEYKRYLFVEAEGYRVAEAQLMIGLCYLRGEKYEAAESLFVDLKNAEQGTAIGEKAAFLYGESVFAQEQYAAAVIHFGSRVPNTRRVIVRHNVDVVDLFIVNARQVVHQR